MSLVRQKQIVELMRSKSKLKDKEVTNMIYIDEACTPDELTKRSKLLNHAKLKKASRYRFFRKTVLEILDRGISGKFHVGDDGNVVPWTEKPGAGTSSGRASRHAQS